MKRFLTLSVLAFLTLFQSLPSAAATAEPSGTYLFAQKEGQDLMLDIYQPAPGSKTSIDGKRKPTVIFCFGGGFFEGSRDARSNKEFFKLLTDSGYGVVSIDYRLGLKGVKAGGMAFVKALEKAISMAVEDLYSATLFLIDNAAELGIDPTALVISGSSAGAITALQAEWELCNRSSRAEVLPADFRYAGVVSMSGAVFSRDWGTRYDREPAPTLLCHGIDDRLVTYKRIEILNISFRGSNALARTYRRNGYNYNIIRFQDIQHEVSAAGAQALPEILRFLDTNVTKGEKRIVDSTVNDPSIKPMKWANSAKELY